MPALINETASSPAKDWSRPYLGITHYGALGDMRRSTINVVATDSVVLKLFVKGDGFNPAKKDFKNIEDAKAAGETWANSI